MALTKVTGQVIKNTTDVTVGVLTVTNTLAVGGTVSIGGTLTYEDVTNVDAVGLITARNGIVVGSGITLSKDGDGFFTGVTTATTFVGALTGTASGNTTISNNADNRVITGGSGVNLNGEANLTFDGSVADLTGKLRIDISSTGTVGSGAAEGIFLRNTNETDNNAVTIFGGADDYSAAASAINFINVDHSANAGAISFDTRSTGNSYAERIRINSNGSVQVTPEGSTSNPYMLIDTSGDSVRFNAKKASGNNEFRFLTQSSGTVAERLRIHSGGQVQIAGDSTASISSFADDLIIGESGSSAISGITLCSTDSSGIRFHDTADMGEIEFDHSDNSLAIKANQILKFRTNNAERARITSDGHLQLGNDTGRIQLGTGQDLQLIHDGGASKIIAKPEFMLQSDEITFRSEDGSSTHAIINSSGQVGIGTNIPGDAVSINGNVRFASGTSVGGSTMGIFPLGDITLAGNASASLALNARFTGIVIVSGYQNDTAAAVFALASASDYSSDSATRLHFQTHNAANTTDLTISSPSHGGTHQFQLNQSGTATKTYKVIAFGIKG